MTPIARRIADTIVGLHTATGPVVVLPESVAEEIGCTERSVRHSLCRLADLGLISWTRRTPGGQRTIGWTVTVLDAQALAAATREVA